MRIDQLKLMAYGPFTNQVLDFSQGEKGLHVVVGANEAGKSSALRALEAALFKIPAQTTDNFLHANPQLRLGLKLRAPDGRVLDFIRKKKNKDALWDSSDSAPIDDQELAAFLANLSDTDFKRIHALNHESLRAGAENLVQPEEGVDAAIVGAALGLRELKAVAEALKAEAGDLFAPRGSTKLINKAIKELKDLEAEMKARSLPERVWSEVRKEREDAERDFQSLRERVTKTRAELDFLEFARSRRERILEVETERQQLSDLGANFDLPADFAQRKQATDQRCSETRIAVELEQERLQKQRQALEELAKDSEILTDGEKILALRNAALAHAGATEDLLRGQSRSLADAEEVQALVKKIGLGFPLSSDDRNRLSLVKEQAQAWAQLREDYHKIGARLASCQAEVERRQLKVKHAESAQPSLTAPVDLRPLESSIKTVRGQLQLEKEVATQSKAVLATERQLATLQAQLLALGCEQEKLAELHLPSEKTVQAALTKFSALDEEQRQIEVERQRLLAELRRAEDKEAEQSAAAAIPSLELLTESRDRRDAQWLLIRRAWLDQEEVSEAAQALDAKRPLAESFPLSMTQADEVADHLRRESDRVAVMEEQRRLQARLKRDLSALDDRAQAAAIRHQELLKDWQSLWLGLSFLSAVPAAMMDVRERIEEFQTLAAEKASLALDLEVATADLSQAVDLLRTTVIELGHVGALPQAGAPLSATLDAAETLLKELLERAEQDRSLAKDLQLQSESLAEARLAWEAAEREFDDWTKTLDSVKAGLGLSPALSVEDALAGLENWRLLATQYEHFEATRERQETNQREAEVLAQQSSELATRHLKSPLPEGLEASLRQLVAEYEAARKVADERSRMQKELQQLEQVVAEHEQTLALARNQQAELAQEARINNLDLLPALITLADLRREMAPRGWKLDEIAKRMAKFQDADLPKEISNRESQISLLEEQVDEKRKIATLARQKLEDFEKESGVEEIGQKIANKKALIREESQRYLKLVLTAQLLTQAQSRFRSRHEEPTLRHASSYLQTLTAGRYVKIDVDLDEKDKSFFLVRDGASGATKVVDQLSDGTRDQLHLALVLGALEHRLDSGSEAMPLILDDVLVHFDDQRSRAALQALADFSARSQVLLFSHHESVAAQARALDRPNEIFVQELRRD